MIIIDVEIKKAIRSKNEAVIEGIEYCDGWRDFANMGVACACTYDVATNLSRVFYEEELADLQAYIAGKTTAGFNTRRFDLPLLEHHGVTVEDQASHFDILESIWMAQGLDPDDFNWKTHGGWSLDNIMQSTFGLGKSGSGAMAPVWWQQGKRGKVVDYCLRDVWLEAQLAIYARKGHPILKDAFGAAVTIKL